MGLSNKRLKLTGAHELGKNCVALPASLFLCASTSLRHRRLRPQLKRDPLGIHDLCDLPCFRIL